ncbi:MAG: hypothetical protein GTO18_19020 [Anaerolineales bacterium]|nr:hypothetical protein [Anaerolineales bacterium]
MRKIIAGGFVVEFVSLIALIISISLAWLGHTLGLSTGVVITASVGISLAASIWALKWWIRREIHETLSLYELLESIDDSDLYERGKAAIEECRIELENLSQGLLRIDPMYLHQTIINITGSAKHNVRLIHIGLDDKHMELVRPAPENQWYQHNLRLVKSGISLDRIFIFPRSKALDPTSQKLQTSIAKVMEKHSKDGIGVFLLWEEMADPDLMQEFIIIDTRLVMTGSQSWSGATFTEMKLSRRRYDVEKYLDIFDALMAQAQPYPEMGKMLSDLNE